MVARCKKPAKRVVSWTAWEPAFAQAFGQLEGWAAPDRVKVVAGARGGTITALFKDEAGQPVEGFIRFRAVAGQWKIIDSGLRLVFRFKIRGDAK